MTFQSWFEREYPKRGGKAEFCRLAVVVHATLMKALAGKPIDKKTAERIAEHTGGAITAASLVFPDPLAIPDKKRKRKAA